MRVMNRIESDQSESESESNPVLEREKKKSVHISPPALTLWTYNECNGHY
jgi:hypothetical protein